MHALVVNPTDNGCFSTTRAHAGPAGQKAVPSHLYPVARPADNATPSVQTTGKQQSTAGTCQPSTCTVRINTNRQHPLPVTDCRQPRPAGNHQGRMAGPLGFDKPAQRARIPANKFSGCLFRICQKQKRPFAPLKSLHPLNGSAVFRQACHAGKCGCAVSDHPSPF